MRMFRLWDYLRTRLWFVPSICVLVGVLLSFGTIAIDRTSGTLLPRSMSPDPDAALSILMSVATSMVTLTGLVLTITMVVVQLAMGQFSPRVLRTILRDRPSQIAIGVFVATFAHSVLVMREVRAPGDGEEGYVPGLAVLVAFVLVLVSVIVLVAYVNHIGQSLRVASIIQSVGDETRELIDKVYPVSAEPEQDGERPPRGEPDREILAPQHGVVYRVQTDELVEVAAQADAVLELVPRIGDFVPEGAPLVRVHCDGTLDDEHVMRSLALGKERTMHEDVAYGFRMLVDVAQRSLTPGMGDPTTATQAIDRLHDCLRQLVRRPFPTGRCYDDGGRLRLVVPVLSWRGYVDLALEELRYDGNVSIQVLRRIEALLEDLLGGRASRPAGAPRAAARALRAPDQRDVRARGRPARGSRAGYPGARLRQRRVPPGARAPEDPDGAVGIGRPSPRRQEDTMSQFDDLLKNISGGQGGGGIDDLVGGLSGGGRGAGGSGGLAALLPMLAPIVGQLLAGGGLQRLLGGMREQGMGNKADSWVGKGQNEAISPDELRRAVGDETIRDAAGRAGVSEEEAASGLAALLPQVVDRVTPEGKVPDEADVDQAAKKLEGLGPALR